MHEQLIRLQLPPVQEAALIRTHVVGAYGNAELFPQGLRQVAHAVCRNQNGAPLRLLENQDILFDVRLLDLFADLHQLFGQNAQYGRLQQCAADRLGQITAEALLPVDLLIIASRIGRQGDYGHILT